MLASGGIDHSVKIWSLQKYYKKRQERNKALPEFVQPRPIVVSRALFSSLCVHGNYIDCIRFAGDYIITKSVDNVAKIWRPDPRLEELLTLNFSKPVQRHVEVSDLQLEDSNQMWWVRLDVSPEGRYLACGSRQNRVVLFDLFSVPRKRLVIPSI